MPIHLPAISRRQFLVRSLAGGAALALSPDLLAAAKRTDPNSWALLADTHLAADRGLVARGINMTDHFTSVSRELLALPKRPAGVFITGDCAYNSGQTGDYRQVADLLEPIRGAQMPVHLALGNHDNRERFWDALPKEKAAPRPLADRQVALLRTPRANWFVLDSLEKTLSTPGLLGQEQLDWLAGALDANAGKPALVLIHHNPGHDRNCQRAERHGSAVRNHSPEKAGQSIYLRPYARLARQTGRQRHPPGEPAAGGLCVPTGRTRRLGPCHCWNAKACGSSCAVWIRRTNRTARSSSSSGAPVSAAQVAPSQPRTICD